MENKEQYKSPGHPYPGLYVHVPFCRSKCSYCDFYSIASTSLVSRWMDSLKREIDGYRDTFPSFDSLYFGGGTPTCLELRDLEEITEYVLGGFSFASDIEMSVEANPGDLDKDRIVLLGNLGFNRISVGVQSFDDGTLSFLGRGHSAHHALKALTDLRSHGFQNIGMDLIYGFDRLSPESWFGTLQKAIELAPEHISCYQLTFGGRNVFTRMKEKGLLGETGESEEVSLFLSTSELLEENGYIHYEISNFARDEKFMSRHNSKYWSRAPYLGLGPSAHSFDGLARWWNVRSIKAYCRALAGGGLPVAGREVMTEEQKIMESISLGLRTRKGVPARDLLLHPQSEKTLAELVSAGFLQEKNSRIAPTRKGFLVADHLPLYFIT